MPTGDMLRTAATSDTALRIAGPSVEWMALLPLLILLVGGLLMLTISSFLRPRVGRHVYPWATVALAVAAAISVVPVWARVQGWNAIMWIDVSHSSVGPFSTIAGAVGVDGFGLFVTVVLCVGVALASLLAPSYLRDEQMEGPSFYVLVLLSASGGVMMAMANDLIVLFIGLETLSIAVYVLTGMNLRRAQSQESGLKYFLLGGFSSAFLLYGIAMLYGATGSTNFIAIKDFMASVVPIHNGLLLIGLALVLLGLAFKIGAVPFHAWSPDAYDGAPSPSVSWMAAGVKVAAAAGFVRVFMLAFSNYAETWKPMIYALAIASMVVGAALAIVQSNVKRMLAYSSISHAGFILMAIESNTSYGVAAVLFYVAVYTFMVAGSFGVVTLVGKGDTRNQLADYRGLVRRSPFLSVVLLTLLLGQAGIPFTAGFFAKFYAVTAAADAHALPLALIGMVSAVISAFLYLRIIVAMFAGGDDGADGVEVPRRDRIPVPVPAGIALTLCALVTILFGLFPDVLVTPSRAGTPAVVALDAPVTTSASATSAAGG